MPSMSNWTSPNRATNKFEQPRERHTVYACLCNIKTEQHSIGTPRHKHIRDHVPNSAKRSRIRLQLQHVARETSCSKTSRDSNESTRDVANADPPRNGDVMTPFPRPSHEPTSALKQLKPHQPGYALQSSNINDVLRGIYRWVVDILVDLLVPHAYEPTTNRHGGSTSTW